MRNELLRVMEASNADFNGNSIRQRWEACQKYAWAVPNKRAIRRIVEAGPVVEIGAGTGYWARFVEKGGGDIIAYDAKPYVNYYCAARHAEVREGGPEMAQKHSNRTLFLCWPPYDEPMATDTLLAYEGQTLIYVGESQHGCTGDKEFHLLLDDLYTQTETIDIPRWWSINDRMEVWRRK